MTISGFIILLILGLVWSYTIYDQLQDEKKQKKKELMNKIYQLWKDNTKKYSDKSTPWLIQMTADMAGVEYMDVVEAIRKGGINEN